MMTADLSLPLLVYQAHDAGVVKPEGCRARDVVEKQRVKRELTGNDIFDSLSETNVFLGLFIKVKKIMKIMKAL